MHTACTAWNSQKVVLAKRNTVTEREELSSPLRSDYLQMMLATASDYLGAQTTPRKVRTAPNFKSTRRPSFRFHTQTEMAAPTVKSTIELLLFLSETMCTRTTRAARHQLDRSNTTRLLAHGGTNCPFLGRRMVQAVYHRVGLPKHPRTNENSHDNEHRLVGLKSSLARIFRFFTFQHLQFTRSPK